MKTDDLNSFSLMPAFAGQYEFACKALDAWMGLFWNRANALAAPWSLGAISALTVKELEEAYNIYSVLPFYADLDRENQNQLLFLQNSLRQRTSSVDALSQIVKYLSNGTYDRVFITVEGDFLYSITLYSDYINFSDDFYNRIINACRELVRPSQQMIYFDANTYEMETDGDVWALALVGIETTNRVNVIKAIRAGMTSAWSLTQAKHLVDQAYDVECPAFATPSLIGATVNFYHSKAEFVTMIQQMYADVASVVDGTFGIYRLGDTSDILRVYANGRVERYE